MKKTSCLGIVIVTCFALGCEHLEEEKLTVGDALEEFTVKNLQLYPVRANAVFLRHRSGLGKYLSLSEAIQQEKVKVTEHVIDSAEGRPREFSEEVNTLFIENTSADTVLILNGEVVEGGQQNRMITKDVLLPPHSGKLDLAVFCVEHGRWSGEDGEFKVTKQSLPPNNIRVNTIKVSDQETVWEDVKVNLDVNIAESQTDNIMDLRSNEVYNQKIKSYLNKLDSAFLDDEDVIGVIAVAGGKIIGCDLFATPTLFTKHYHNLLQSYSAEAIGLKDGVGMSKSQVESFLNDLLNDRTKSGGFLREPGQLRNSERMMHVAGL